MKDDRDDMSLFTRFHLMQAGWRQANLCHKSFTTSVFYDAHGTRTAEGRLPLRWYFRMCSGLYLSHLLRLTKLVAAKERDFETQELQTLRSLGMEQMPRRYYRCTFYAGLMDTEMYHLDDGEGVKLIEIVDTPWYFKPLILCVNGAVLSGIVVGLWYAVKVVFG